MEIKFFIPIIMILNKEFKTGLKSTLLPEEAFVCGFSNYFFFNEEVFSYPQIKWLFENLVHVYGDEKIEFYFFCHNHKEIFFQYEGGNFSYWFDDFWKKGKENYFLLLDQYMCIMPNSGKWAIYGDRDFELLIIGVNNLHEELLRKIDQSYRLSRYLYDDLNEYLSYLRSGIYQYDQLSGLEKQNATVTINQLRNKFGGEGGFYVSEM